MHKAIGVGGSGDGWFSRTGQRVTVVLSLLRHHQPPCRPIFIIPTYVTSVSSTSTKQIKNNCHFFNVIIFCDQQNIDFIFFKTQNSWRNPVSYNLQAMLSFWRKINQDFFIILGMGFLSVVMGMGEISLLTYYIYIYHECISYLLDEL